MTTLGAFALVIGILVLVHELGHFLMARWFGVRVDVFSVGFGPKLLAVRRGATEYRLSAVPLGGYVKMAGTNPGAQAPPPDGYLAKRRYQRFLILLAGPAMNIAFAIALSIAGLMYGVDVPAFWRQPAVVAGVTAGSPADAAGLQPGDRIITIGAETVTSWSSAATALASQGDGAARLGLLRDGSNVSVVVEGVKGGDLSSIGALADMRPAVHDVIAGRPADRAGLREGDVIVRVGDRPTYSPSDVDAALSGTSGLVPVTVVREGGTLAVELTRMPEGTEALGFVTRIAIDRVQAAPLTAVRLGVVAVVTSAGFIVNTLAGLVTGDVSPQHLIGPVGLAQMAGEWAEDGWMALLELMAFVSLNLGLCNLLPIPLLDGGHLLTLVIERLQGRDLSVNARRALVRAGIALMLLLFATTIYNDLGRLGWLPGSAVVEQANAGALAQ